MAEVSLSAVPVGERAVVSAAGGSGSMRQRLLDLGLVEGTEVEPLFESILRNPRAYLIRGAVIALRNEDTDSIKVTL